MFFRSDLCLEGLITGTIDFVNWLKMDVAPLLLGVLSRRDNILLNDIIVCCLRWQGRHVAIGYCFYMQIL